jgi:hypothetical protein
MPVAIATIRTIPFPGASVLVCLAACLGGLLGRIIADVRAPTPTLLLGLSPLELLVMFFATRAILRSDEPRDVGAPHIISGLALLAPSGGLAWIALCAFASWRFMFTQGQARIGFALFSVLALSEIWMSIGFKILGGYLLPLDAQLAAHTLALLGFPTQVVGNVVQVSGGNNIVVLITCASLHRMSLALLAAIALSVTALGARATLRQLAVIGALAAAGYAALNLLRLVLMGWSAPLYAFMHDGHGASLYDAAQTMLVFLVSRSRNAEPKLVEKSV